LRKNPLDFDGNSGHVTFGLRTGGLRETHPTVPTAPPMSLPNPNSNLNPNPNPKTKTNPNPIFKKN